MECGVRAYMPSPEIYRMLEKVVTLPKILIGTRIREWYHPKRCETVMWIVYSFVPLRRLKLRLCPFGDLY